MDGFYKTEIVIENEKQLIDLIDSEMASPLNEKKPIAQIFDDCGIDGAQLLDNRTMDILSNYEFYKNAPHLAFDNEVWFQSVKILNKLEPRLF